jgi:ABC-type transport system involved in multi-copper enzyme maturation permease subunit
MTTQIAPPPAASTAAGTYRSVGFDNVLRSEWTKLRSLRSTTVCGTLAVVATIGLAVALGARWAHQTPGTIQSDFDATNVSLSGVYIAQLIVGTLGAMTISSEYTTGMIRATFSAVPQRRAVLAAKALVLVSVTLVLAEITCFISFGICQALLVHQHVGASLSDPGVLRAVSGAGLYLAAIALLGFGLGATIRHTAGALSAFFGILFAPSALVDLLPTQLRNDLINYMPANSGSQVFTIVRVHGSLSPWTGLGVFCLYVLAALLTGFVLVGVRDA